MLKRQYGDCTQLYSVRCTQRRWRCSPTAESSWWAYSDHLLVDWPSSTRGSGHARGRRDTSPTRWGQYRHLVATLPRRAVDSSLLQNSAVRQGDEQQTSETAPARTHPPTRTPSPNPDNNSRHHTRQQASPEPVRRGRHGPSTHPSASSQDFEGALASQHGGCSSIAATSAPRCPHGRQEGRNSGPAVLRGDELVPRADASGEGCQGRRTKEGQRPAAVAAHRAQQGRPARQRGAEKAVEGGASGGSGGGGGGADYSVTPWSRSCPEHATKHPTRGTTYGATALAQRPCFFGVRAPSVCWGVAAICRASRPKESAQAAQLLAPYARGAARMHAPRCAARGRCALARGHGTAQRQRTADSGEHVGSLGQVVMSIPARTKALRGRP